MYCIVSIRLYVSVIVSTFKQTKQVVRHNS